MCRTKLNRIVGDKRYQVIDEFKEECKRNANNYSKTGRLHIIQDNIDITESDKLIDFTIEDNCYVNDKFIGTTVAKKITVNILNPNNEIDLENKEIQPYIGMLIDGENKEVPYGTFIIEKPQNEEVKQKTSFTGYDYMIKFNVLYKNTVTFPCKAKVLFQNICTQVGLEAGKLDFINCEYMILGNPFTNNEDCRTVLSNIAQLAGGFAKIGRDNKVYIKTLKNISNLLTVKDVHTMSVKELNFMPISRLIGIRDKSDETLDGNNYFEDFAKNNMWGELNSLVLGLSSIEGENTSVDDEDSIQENGLTEIVINDNYFLIEQVEREKVIEPLWSCLKGIKYLPFKAEYYGYPYIDSGDMIYIEDTKDKGYISYIFNHTFKFDGSYSGKIETPALTKTQTAYKNKIDIKTRFFRAERKIDKINGVIEDIIEEQTETSNKLSQHEQTIDSITNTVSETNTQLTKDINNNYQDILKKLNEVPKNDDLVTIQNKVETIEKSTEYAINVTEDLQINGVSKVKTETGYTFDNEGLTIEKTDAKTKSTLNEAGLNIKDATGSSEESLLFAGYDEETGETIVKSKNMTVEKYLTIGKNSRLEDYKNGTGVFGIGG